MKLTIAKTKEKEEPVDIKEIYENFLDKYDSVFIQDFGESGTFIFTSLGRKDFREIIETDLVSEATKEEIICERCTLWPKDYDFENCDEAGLPTQLCEQIIEKSLLKKSDQMINAIHYCRDKLAKSLDDQITCTIHEAFPEYTIEEIANWDVAKTAEYMTNAEFILHNLRGVPMAPVNEQPAPEEPMGEPPMQPMEERFAPMPQQTERSATANPQKKQPKHNDGKILHKDDVLTPSKLAELQRLYPDIDWAHDAVRMNGAKALQGQHFDDRPIAEIPLDGSEEGENAIPLALRDRFKVVAPHEDDEE